MKVLILFSMDLSGLNGDFMIHNRAVLDELKMLRADMAVNDQDLLISVFGSEGSGKSVFAMNLGKVLDSAYGADCIAITVHDFARIAPKTEPIHVVHWDEAHHFSRRGMYDTDVNRVLLKYFQTIRGAKRIVILCYPALQEMDRYITQHRTRLFFETIKKGNQYLVRGWRKEQILAKLDTMRLYKQSSKSQRWKGIPRNPIVAFGHDFTGIEQIISDYKLLKRGSLSEADDELLSTFGYYNLMDVVRKLMSVTDYSVARLKTIVSEEINQAVKDNDNIRVKGGRYTITDEKVFNKLFEVCLERLPRAPDLSQISCITHDSKEVEVVV